MSQDKIHDLYDFMRQLSNDMAAEYERIQKRATEDPGTAGDQGEENWAELLRGWLPRTYKVVTKGRIIGVDGRTSPQIDVLVLKSIYPEKLLNKKLYLAAGVAAAFECKNTLRAEHIEKAVETCVKIKNLYPVRKGTPYKELQAPIVCGLLAHSHSWKGNNSTPEDNIQQKLIMSDSRHVSHPRQGLDLLCVADLTTWTLDKITFLSQLSPHDPNYVSQETEMITSYMRQTAGSDIQIEDFTSIGVLISNLSKRLAWEDLTLRDLADYYYDIKLTSTSSGIQRKWQANLIYSSEVFFRLWDSWTINR